MVAREKLNHLKEQFGPAILRADLPGDTRLYVFVEPAAIKPLCQYLFRDLDARYVISIGADDRPFSGTFLVAHNFAFDRENLLASVIAHLPAERPQLDSISDVVPAANWAEREIRDLVGIEFEGHPRPERLILADDWPQGVYPLRKDKKHDA